MKTKLLLTTIIMLSIAVTSQGQNLVINGNFEENIATQDMVNCTSPQFDSLMSNVYSFGIEVNPDIIETSDYCNYPKDSKWYVSLTGGGTDNIAMKLSSPIVAGNKYVLSYWMEGCDFGLYKPEFGISSDSVRTGTVVYVGPTSKNGVWVNYVDTFTASTSGSFLTLAAANGDISCWNQYDSIVLLNVTATTASIQMPATVCSNQLATITYNGNGNSTDTYTWNFNNGNVISGSGVGPYQVAWATAGIYYVSVKVTTSTGDTATSIETITVNAPPTATFALDTVIAAGQTDLINYTGNGSTNNSSFNWTFTNALIENNNGDTSYSTTWVTPGIYNVALTVSQNGCTSAPASRPVYVANPLTLVTPICTDSISTVLYSGFLGNTTNYSWSFSGANIVAGSGAGPYTLQYLSPGTYPVTLNITIDSVNYSFTDTIMVADTGVCSVGNIDSIGKNNNNNNNGSSASEQGDSAATAGINIAGKPLVIDNIYPNPTLGDLNVDFQTSVPGSVHFEVYDVLGRLIISNYNTAGGNVNTTVLNTSQLPAGSYFVRIIEDSANFSDTKKFIKLL